MPTSQITSTTDSTRSRGQSKCTTAHRNLVTAQRFPQQATEFLQCCGGDVDIAIAHSCQHRFERIECTFERGSREGGKGKGEGRGGGREKEEERPITNVLAFQHVVSCTAKRCSRNCISLSHIYSFTRSCGLFFPFYPFFPPCFWVSNMLVVWQYLLLWPAFSFFCLF